MPNTIYAGTIGQSIWRSTDTGETWHRASNGVFPEADIRAIVVHPTDPNTLYAGTEKGVVKTTDGGNSWNHLPSDMDSLEVWSLAIHPTAPETLFAGTCPSAFFKTTDGGEMWTKLDAELAQECEGIPIIPRVTTIIIDPEDTDTVYAGIEIDGMRMSTDGGETWHNRSEGLSSQDIHGLTVVPGEQKTLVAATNNDVCITTDMHNWTPLKVRDHFPWSYCRAAFYLNGDNAKVFIGAGNGPPGDQGGIFYMKDSNAAADAEAISWDRSDIGMTANSTIWTFGYNSRVDGLLIACSVSGQLFLSEDNGGSWAKLTHEFGEVRALAVA